MAKGNGVSRRAALQIVVGLASIESFTIPVSLTANQAMPPVILRRANEMAWQPMQNTFFPPGLKTKSLYIDRRKNTSLSLIRYPKGYREPRHYHKNCGHWLYFLNGRLRDSETVYSSGTFVYAPPGNVHGPYIAEEASEVLFFVDGPFDVFPAH